MAIAPDDDAQPLDGGWQTTVRHVGDTVRRSASPWSAATITLLAHLASVGFAGSPRPIGSGFDRDGNEILTFVDGASPQPHSWTDDAIVAIGQMLRQLHADAASFMPAADAPWKDWFGRHLGDTTAGFGHGDLGPWNIMAVDGMPSGFIDWDTAGPMDPTYELAQVAWLNVQLHDDDIAERVGLGSAADRARQLGLLVDSYGLGMPQRRDFVDKMIEVAVHDAAGEALGHAITPETTGGVADDGYPFAWGMAWRIRSAAWMLRHRSLLERASIGPSLSAGRSAARRGPVDIQNGSEQ